MLWVFFPSPVWPTVRPFTHPFAALTSHFYIYIDLCGKFKTFSRGEHNFAVVLSYVCVEMSSLIYLISALQFDLGVRKKKKNTSEYELFSTEQGFCWCCFRGSIGSRCSEGPKTRYLAGTIPVNKWLKSHFNPVWYKGVISEGNETKTWKRWWKKSRTHMRTFSVFQNQANSGNGGKRKCLSDSEFGKNTQVAIVERK